MATSVLARQCLLVTTVRSSGRGHADLLLRPISVHGSANNRRNSSSNQMTFEEYRKLRKSLRTKGRISGIPMAFIGMAASSAVNMQLNPRMFDMTPEEIQPILGMDPIVFAAVCGAATGVVGFALGGTVFNLTWRTLRRNLARQMDTWEENFLSRLQKFRFSDVNEYQDDYYGERVVTLSDYRQWIRQQHKKRDKFRAAMKSSDKQEDVVAGGNPSHN